MKSRFVLATLVAAAVLTVLFLPEDILAADVDISVLDTDCIATDLKTCTILSSGRLNKDWGDDTGAPMLAWQTQTGFTDADGIMGGFVLLAFAEGHWSVLDSGFDGARFGTPHLGMDDTLLHIPGVSGGTGGYNLDRLYRLAEAGDAGNWQRIDIETWREGIATHLPEGLEIWKGVDFDFADWFYDALSARTPLWRVDDANCCPTGGWATIHFDIDAEARLVVTDMTFTPSAEE